MEKKKKNFDSFFEELNETAFGKGSLFVQMGLNTSPKNLKKSLKEEYKNKLHKLVGKLIYEESKRIMGEGSMENVFFIAEKINNLKESYTKVFSPEERLLSAVLNDN